ncbi:hypothetical protein EV715DRAFT_214110 [Schizophyllum commune]
MSLRSLLLALSLSGASSVLAQEGSISGAQSSPEAAGYSCDADKCKLPDCNCASTSPPGGLDPKDVPQFIVFTADDAVETYTIDAVNQFLQHRQNPNGCQPKMTYFTSLNYTNFGLVTDWFVAGNEIADHTMTHVGSPPPEEINGNIIALNALSGIPVSAIQGFRAPYLEFTVDTLKHLANASFTYDSSAAASVPVTDEGTDAFWPYTLDYGMANNCLAVDGLCKGEPKLPGFWEIPMYSFFDDRGAAGPHLMDPWLEAANGDSKVDNEATLEYMKNTFTAHYENNRQPIGLYTHPIHVASNYPGVKAPKGIINMINAFLDWAQEQDNVWIVSNEQLLAWVRDPKPVSQLDSVGALKCSTPSVDKNICNGMPDKESGLQSKCTFDEYPFDTCYGCPEELPTVKNPNPKQAPPDGESERHRLPDNCTTAFWDPIEGECICTSDTCEFHDTTRPIGPNGANLTGGNKGDSFGNEDQDDDDGSSTFNGPNGADMLLPSLLLALVGGAVGVVGLLSQL